MEASSYDDLYSMLLGHTVECRDVVQAYFQVEMEGPVAWIMLPRELWTQEMHNMKCPVVRLRRAL